MKFLCGLVLVLATVSTPPRRRRRSSFRSPDLGGPRCCSYGAWRILKAKRQIADTALLKNKFKNEIYTGELNLQDNNEARHTLQTQNNNLNILNIF